MTAELQHSVGRHDEAIENLKGEVREMRAALARIEATLNETKGGVRVLLAVGATGGAIGAAVMKALAYVKGGGA